MALRDKKDMQRQLLGSGIAILGLVIIMPLFVMFTVSKPTPSIAPSAISLDGNTCARIGYTTDGMYPITPERCLRDIEWARTTGGYANPIDGLYALKRQGDERACEMSQRTPQGQDACRRQYR
jgi:hypothetical protein